MLTPPELLFQIESDIMRNIISELQVGKATPARWKASRLKAMGKLNTANVNLLKKYETLLNTGTAAEIKQAQTDALYRIDTIYQKAVPDLAPPINKISEATQKVTNAFITQGGKDLNYTRQSLLHGANKIYRETIEQASYKYLQGVTTLDQALKETCTKWISQGSIAIKDAGGRNWSPESYSRMVLGTNSRQVTTQVSLERNKEWGNDLIEISSHVGAREKCAPYQGHIYTTGRSKKYHSLSSTSYGEAAGLFGINCRHDSYPFIEGVNSKTFDPMPFNEKEYNLSQAQRHNEVNIRNAKRKLALQKQNGDVAGIKRATKSVKDEQANMRSFIGKTGRTRHYNRERIFT